MEPGASADAYGPIGAAARAAGTPAFEGRLLDFVAGVADHDYLWAVRYDSSTETHVFETRFIDERLVEDYKDRYHEDDPFGRHWRRRRRSGVVLSDEVMDDTPSSRRYQSEFQRRASITDEIGLLLPLPAGACLGLFLESRSRFGSAQIKALQDAAPVAEALACAHAVKLTTAHDTLAPGRDPFALGRDADREPSEAQLHNGASRSPDLTRLERDILTLISRTRSSGEIASALNISKGTVKKYKIRLYRKYGVQSERQLISSIHNIDAAGALA